MCNEFCEGWRWADVCALAADCGYQGVELAPFTVAEDVRNVSPSARAALRREAQDRGLEIIGLHWLLVKPTGLHLNSPDPAVRRATVRYLHDEVDFCADLGGTRMIIGSPKQRSVPPGQTYEEVWDRSVASFAELADHAQQRGVILCVEPLSPAETNFITIAEEALRLVEAVGSPAFQMMLDVKAMCSEKEPIPAIIRKSSPWLKHFHANDANLQGPGFGQTDFRPIAEALRQVAYDGYISVEVFDFSAGPQRIARESIQYLRSVFG